MSPISIGYANEGIKENHYHEKMFEVYLVAKGTATIDIEGRLVSLKQGEMLAIEPGEVHTFLNSSDDYFHFVIHSPFVKGDKKLASL